jgi:hypothetical protein
MSTYKEFCLQGFELFRRMAKLTTLKFAHLAVSLLLTFSLVSSCGVFKNDPVTMNAPPPPNGFKVELAQELVKLSWEPVAGATHYTIFWGFEGREYNKLSDSLDCSILVEGLNAGELYSFLVTAWNHNGESDFSREAVLVYDDSVERSRSHAATGTQLFSDGAIADAQAYLSAATRLDPESADAYLNRGLPNERTNFLEPGSLDNSRARKLSDGNIEITQK